MKNINTLINRRIVISVLLLSSYLTANCAAQETKPSEPILLIAQSTAKSGPSSPTSKIYLGSDGKLAGTGSPDRPASEVYRLGKGVHPQALSLPGLPKDKFGLIDWNLMIKKKVITPAGSLYGDKKEKPLLDLNILIHTKGDFVHNVIFRHKPHNYWLDCKNCHPKIFIMGKGKNKMSMQGIVKGKWCGRCHGKVSFPLTDCKRCHSKSKP